MNKIFALIMIVFLTAGMSWAQEKRVVKPVEQDSVKRPLLTQLRKENAKAYKKVKVMQRTQPGIRSVETRYRFQKCTPCDTRYVAQLLAKEEPLTKAEMGNLLCTFQPQCRDNAEFMPMYNELIHRAIDRSPTRFFDEYEAPERSQYRQAIDDIMMNPVRDDVDKQKIIRAVRSRIQQKRSIRTRSTQNTSSRELLENLQQKLEADVERKRLDVIRRKNERRN